MRDPTIRNSRPYTRQDMGGRVRILRGPLAGKTGRVCRYPQPGKPLLVALFPWGRLADVDQDNAERIS